MIRVVCISDLHGDWYTDGFARFDDAMDSLDAAVGYAVETPVDLFAFLGDAANPEGRLGDVRVADALGTRAVYLAECGVQSVWIAGNHDVVEDGSGTSTLTPMRPLERASRGLIRIVEAPGCMGIQRGGARVLFGFLPYPSRAGTYDAGKIVAEDFAKAAYGSQSIVLLSHLQVLALEAQWSRGAPRGSEDGEMARGKPRPFPEDAVVHLFEQTNRPVTVLQGHYHAPCSIYLAGGAYQMHVVGSPERLTHGEEGKACSFLELTIDGAQHWVKRHLLESRKVWTLGWNDGSDLQEHFLDGARYDGDLVRLLPPPGEGDDGVREMLLERGAAAARVEGRAPQVPNAPAAERGRIVEGETHRQVVDRLAAAIQGDIGPFAREEVSRIADEEKL